MNVFFKFFLCMISSFLFAQDFIEGEHFFRVQGENLYNQTEVHYFFSYNCHFCKKFSKEFANAFNDLPQDTLIKKHVFIKKESDLLLAKTYYLMTKYNNYSQNLNDTLFQLAEENSLSEDIFLKRMAHKSYENLFTDWSDCSIEEVKDYLKDSAQWGKELKLAAFPSCYVIGPKGCFYIYPSKKLPIEKISACLKYLIAAQK